MDEFNCRPGAAGDSIRSIGRALLIAGSVALWMSGCSGDAEPAQLPSETYSDQFVDNSGNTINLTTTFIESVNPDGSFSDSSSTEGADIATNGTTYGYPDETDNYDASDGLVSLIYTNDDITISCSFSPAAVQIPPYPLYVGETWSENWTQTCSEGNTYMTALTGGIVDAEESITVPAGTFDALKIQYRIVRSNFQNALVETRDITQWRNSITGLLLKLDAIYTYNMPPNGANGYAASEEVLLISHTP